MSSVQAVLVMFALDETLAPRFRKKLGSLQDVILSSNPLSFLRIFTHGSVVARLSSIASLQCFCEGKALSDLNTYYLQNDAKFPDSLRAIYRSSFGIVMTISGVIGKQTIAAFGMRGHTTFQNVASILGFTIMGSSLSKYTIFGALPFYAFAMERRAAMSSLAVKAAAAAGMGTG